MNRHLQVPRLLWFALLMASVIYPVIVLFFLQNGGVPARSGTSMAPALYPVALLAAAMSFVMPRLGLARALAPFASRVGAEVGGAGQPPWPGYRAPVASERVVRLTDADRRALMRVLQPRFILALALSESVSLLGFMLGFLGHAPLVWVPVSAAGTLLIALRFPTARWALGAVERAHGARATLVDA